jgi:hypothetical protein
MLAIFLLSLIAVSQADVTVVRPDTPESLVNSMTNPECTSIFSVDLEAQYSNQGNDISMTQTQGKDTRIPMTDPRYNNFNDLPGWGTTLVIGFDYRNFPFPNNTAVQAQAAAAYSVPSLTQPSGTPMGFVQATSRMYYSVCVNVIGTYGRWVEIMAEVLHSQQQICVSDWNRVQLNTNPWQETCGNGYVYECRESPMEVGENQNDAVGFQFYCKEECDDASFNFYFRFSASQLPTADGANQPDAADWCMMRDGDDYPSSLLNPYPVNYVPPPVFGTSTGGASTATVTVTSVMALAALALLRYLF